MKRYTEYKDSGVPWIGDIPGHWILARNKAFLLERKESVGKRTEYPLLSLTREGVIYRDIESGKGKFPKDYDTYKIVSVGDVIFCLFDVDETPRTVGLSEIVGMITGAYNVFAIHDIDKRFLYYFYIAIDDKKGMRPLYTGLRKVINVNKFLSAKIAIPTPAEQEKIVAFLDKQTNLIESCICLRERELQTLIELKQAKIASAVTRGLNPDVPMKDSGIPWIGMIPDHWKIRRAKYMFRKQKRPVSGEDEVVTCFRDGQVTLRKNRRTTGFTESLTEVGYQGIKKGDLVIHQMDAFAGAIGVSDSDGKGTSVYHCCTPKGKYDVYYYALLLRVMAQTGFIQSLYRGIRERSSDFNFNTFGNQFLAVPPIEEQQQIVKYIQDSISKVDKYISSLEKEIEYLKEYKQRLISDVVTGKVDVRDEA